MSPAHKESQGSWRPDWRWRWLQQRCCTLERQQKGQKMVPMKNVSQFCKCCKVSWICHWRISACGNGQKASVKVSLMLNDKDMTWQATNVDTLILKCFFLLLVGNRAPNLLWQIIINLSSMPSPLQVFSLFLSLCCPWRFLGSSRRQ